MAAADVNAALRAYVTGTSFSLSLTRAQVEYLVYLDLFERREAMLMAGTFWDDPSLAPSPGAPPKNSHYAWSGLERRGLAARPVANRGLKITEAGRLVIGLLKQAGIWQEHEAIYTQCAERAVVGN